MAFILVIDDSFIVRKIVEVVLRREGYEVLGFPDGIEALQWITTPQARVPDLIVLDICLPQLNGYEVARRLKNQPRLGIMAIIMLTRRDGMIDRLKGRLAGARGYLTKPFKTQELLQEVQLHLRAVDAVSVPLLAGHHREDVGGLNPSCQNAGLPCDEGRTRRSIIERGGQEGMVPGHDTSCASRRPRREAWCGSVLLPQTWQKRPPRWWRLLRCLGIGGILRTCPDRMDTVK
jgi:twitching motility two-component system response regulator PilG